MVHVAADATHPSRGEIELGPGDEHFGVGEVMQAAGVIRVEVGEDDLGDIGGADAQLLQAGPDLLLGLHPLAYPEAEVRMPAWEVAGLACAGGLAGVHHDHPFGMLDRKGVDRQRLSPLAVEHGHQTATAAVPDTLPLAALDCDRPRLDRVDLHLGAQPRMISSTTPLASRSSMGPPVTSSR